MWAINSSISASDQICAASFSRRCVVATVNMAACIRLGRIWRIWVGTSANIRSNPVDLAVLASGPGVEQRHHALRRADVAGGKHHDHAVYSNKPVLQVTQQRWPKVRFHTVREHGQRLVLGCDMSHAPEEGI